MAETRQIVVPGEVVGSSDVHQPGQNTYMEGKEIYALRLGVKSVRGDRVNVIGLSGRYEPGRGDMVIGTIAEVGPSNWYINIGAANDVGMHVNDVPWRVEFGETAKYLAVGDSVLLKIVHVDEMKKAQVSMKDRQCRKLTGGLIYDVIPAKVPRIVGRNGSMIGLIKDATNVRIFVGQNGLIWVDGEPDDVKLALEALQKIEAEAHTSGLTDRMKAWLEERRPSEKRVHKAAEEEAGESGEAAEEFRPRERRARPAVVRDESAEQEYDRERAGPPRHERHHSERRAHAGERREHRGGREEHRGPPRDEPRSERPPPRRFEEERPARRSEEEPRGPRRFEEARPARRSDDERPARRFEEERPARRFEEERPARRSEEERPARRFEEDRPARRPDAERPVRRFEEERPARRFEDDRPRRPMGEERPARRFEGDLPRHDERPARRVSDEDERPARRTERTEEEPRRARPMRFEEGEEAMRRPPPRASDDDDARPARREGGDDEGGDRNRRRRGGRGRGSDRDDGPRSGGSGRGGSGRREE